MLTIANKLYGNKSGGSFKATYLSKANAFYNAAPEMVDFCKKTETAKIINDWVASKTNDKIKDLVPPTALSCSTRIVLVNAIYFNGTWKFKFDKRFTKQRRFTTLDGRNVMPEMELNPRLDKIFKHLNGFKVFEGDESSIDAQIFQLPLYKGYSLSMYIVLPTPNMVLTLLGAFWLV